MNVTHLDGLYAGFWGAGFSIEHCYIWTVCASLVQVLGYKLGTEGKSTNRWQLAELHNVAYRLWTARFLPHAIHLLALYVNLFWNSSHKLLKLTVDLWSKHMVLTKMEWHIGSKYCNFRVLCFQDDIGRLDNLLPSHRPAVVERCFWPWQNSGWCLELPAATAWKQL